MRIGIDLGGTKTEGILLDDKGGEVARQRINTPRGAYHSIVDTVGQLVDDMRTIAGQSCTIGVGTPGSLNSQGLLRNSNTVELNGKPLQKDLENCLQQAVRLSNDANCFALSEASDGAAAGCGNVFGVIIGTGTGGGLIINGQLVAGSNHIAGEWGHNSLPWLRDDERPGPLCYCGKRACIETFLSGPGLAASYRVVSGRNADAKEIVARAESGESEAESSLSRYEDQLARALASLINVVDPQCIVLGGGMSNIARLYQRVPTMWAPYIFSDSVSTRLLAPKHGDSSGVRGAAWLWDTGPA